MKIFGKTVLVVLALAVALGLLALLRNAPALYDPPGPAARLSTYLTTHVAETADDAVFPELRTPVCVGDPQVVLDDLEQSAVSLGWGGIRRQGNRIQAVVTSPLWRFEDDFSAQAELLSPGRTRLRLGSTSRVGRGDLAANSAHILALLKDLNGRGRACAAQTGDERS